MTFIAPNTATYKCINIKTMNTQRLLLRFAGVIMINYANLELDPVPFNHMELPHDDYGWLFIYKIDYPYLPLSSWKRRKICGIFLVYLAIRHYFIIFVAEYAAFNAVL